MAGPSGRDGNRGKSRGEAVYQGLRRAIIEAALRPGTKLPEDAVGESFGVSRTIMRSVLARLASEGLVTQQVEPPGRGGRADTGGRARLVPGPARAGAHRGRASGRQAQQGPGGQAGRPCGCRECRRGPRRPGLDPARRRVPHPAGRHDRQRDPGPLCQRGGLARLAGAGDLRPAALVGLRRERAQGADRGPGRGQTERAIDADGPASRQRGQPGAAGAPGGPRARSERAAAALRAAGEGAGSAMPRSSR